MTVAATAFTLDDTHPNYARWQRAIDNAVLRGEFVCAMVELEAPLNGATVLDAGCGIGGTSIALHRHGAKVTAVDRNPARLQALNEREPAIDTVPSGIESLPFPNDAFDAVILQDVIEHTIEPARILGELRRVMKPNGVLYLSTPNRASLLNVLADPHWGLPFASLMKRETLRKTLRRKRPSDAGRDDLAQLLSYKEITDVLMQTGFAPSWVTRQALRSLFREPRGLVWSEAHLAIVGILQRLRLGGIIGALYSFTRPFTDRYLTPTWYLLCRKAAR